MPGALVKGLKAKPYLPWPPNCCICEAKVAIPISNHDQGNLQALACMEKGVVASHPELVKLADKWQLGWQKQPCRTLLPSDSCHGLSFVWNLQCEACTAHTTSRSNMHNCIDATD